MVECWTVNSFTFNSMSRFGCWYFGCFAKLEEFLPFGWKAHLEWINPHLPLWVRWVTALLWQLQLIVIFLIHYSFCSVCGCHSSSASNDRLGCAAPHPSVPEELHTLPTVPNGTEERNWYHCVFRILVSKRRVSISLGYLRYFKANQ